LDCCDGFWGEKRVEAPMPIAWPSQTEKSSANTDIHVIHIPTNDIAHMYPWGCCVETETDDI